MNLRWFGLVRLNFPIDFMISKLLKSPYSETVDLWPLQLFSNPNHESKPTSFGGEQIREKLKLYLSFNKIEESWTPEVND